MSRLHAGAQLEHAINTGLAHGESSRILECMLRALSPSRRWHEHFQLQPQVLQHVEYNSSALLWKGKRGPQEERCG